MGTERLYYDDCYTRSFTAEVVRRGEHGGRPAVELVATYFYPESGGQEADRGTLGDLEVIDVQADDDGTVWHVLGGADGALPVLPEAGATLSATVDWTRRFDLMQQHTGQHILSAAFERVQGGATVSSHLGVERSSIDITAADVDWAAIGRVEAAANAVVWSDLEVVRHWTDADGVKQFALRKPPATHERIRIVEVPDWDLSACGGTHVRRTGEIGVIKVVRWEKVRGNVRFEFLCAARALADHAWRVEAMVEAAKRRTLKDAELIPSLERVAIERDRLQKQVRDWTDQRTRAEAIERVGAPPRPVAEHRDDWTRDMARTFALQCLEAGAPWVVAGAGADHVVFAGRQKRGDVDVREALPQALATMAGKGGGSPDLIQIAAPDSPRARAGFELLQAWLRKRFEG